MNNSKEVTKFTTFVILLAAFMAWMHDGYSLVMTTLLAPQLKTFFGVIDAAMISGFLQAIHSFGI
ncbi:MAG: hypothetical protein ACFFEY_10075 [Candidatus Thorarchaeota archaeon]